NLSKHRFHLTCDVGVSVLPIMFLVDRTTLYSDLLTVLDIFIFRKSRLNSHQKLASIFAAYAGGRK
ncbi:MAG: hypothetical protein ABJX82_10460, partial [Paracoccaceae bacterium]